MNRGGKLPLTHSYFLTCEKDLENISIPQKSTANGCSEVGPVYVIDETNDYLHVADEDDGHWDKEWVTTFAVRKDAVTFTRNERITSGGPRQFPIP
jgi:hypothetical protein